MCTRLRQNAFRIGLLWLLLVFVGCSASPSSDQESSPRPDTSANPDTSWSPDPALPESSFVTVLEVGTGKQYADPSAVPWESLEPGTLVKIHHRPQAYADKWVIAVAGTAERPVVIRGVPDTSGQRPVITGQQAKTRIELDYWNEARSVIKIGGSGRPSGTPSHIAIENLEIRSAHPSYTYTDDAGAPGQAYSSNAASIHIEEGNHITIRNCLLTDSGNGLFAGSSASDILIDGNLIQENGIVNSIYQHNSYTEALRITFQFNHYAPLKSGALGNSLKDRSAGTVIRYNWMDGGNRPLDLVESDSAALLADSAYRETFVYGNVLIKNDVNENGQVVHYGGDGSDTAKYRKGTLWFFNNTVVSYRSANTTLFGLSTNDESVQAFNNIVHAVAGGSKLALADAKGTIQLFNSFLTSGWRQSFSTFQGAISSSNILAATDPALADVPARNYSLSASGPLVSAGVELPTSIAARHPLTREYVPHQSSRARYSSVDLGAFAK